MNDGVWILAVGSALGNIWQAAKYLIDRNDRNAAASSTAAETEKALKVAQEAVTAKNIELAKKDEELERKDVRIAHLESLLARYQGARP